MKTMPTWLLGCVLFGPFVASLLYFVAPVGSLGPVLYGATKVSMLLLPLVMRPWRWARKPAMRVPAQHKKSLIYGVVTGVAAMAVVLGFGFGPLAWLTEAAGPGVRDKIAQFGIAEQFLLFGAFISLVHSAFEEYYWRWFALHGLVENGRSRGVHEIAALAFSLHHMVVVGMYLGPVWGVVIGLCVGCAGWMWSRLYTLTGSLLGPWVSHILADVAIFILGYSLLN